jgi:hypothetical protein
VGLVSGKRASEAGGKAVVKELERRRHDTPRKGQVVEKVPDE